MNIAGLLMNECDLVCTRPFLCDVLELVIVIMLLILVVYVIKEIFKTGDEVEE